MDSLNSSELDALLACARERSFTLAAKRLSVTQSALSQRIRNLEERLETTLLIRERGGLILTEAGEEVLRYCQAKERLEAEVLGRIRGGKNELVGTIRIGGFSSVTHSVLLPSVRDLLAKNPGLRLKLLSREIRDLDPLLRTGEIDFMVTNVDRGGDALESHLLGHERVVLVERRGYRGPEIYLDHDESDPTTAKYLGRRSPESIPRHFVDDIHGLIQGVLNGVGRAVIPLHLIEENSEIKILNPKRVLKLPVYLCSHRTPIRSRLLELVGESIRNHAANILG